MMTFSRVGTEVHATTLTAAVCRMTKSVKVFLATPVLNMEVDLLAAIPRVGNFNPTRVSLRESLLCDRVLTR